MFNVIKTIGFFLFNKLYTTYKQKKNKEKNVTIR